MAPNYTLNYFDLAGLAEPIRMMFHAAGVEFTDNRISREDWPKQKTDSTRFPLANIPTLQVDNKVITQSQAIARFVARECGFYGNNSCEEALVDQICETFLDVTKEGFSIMFVTPEGEEKKKKLEEFFTSQKTKMNLGFINNILKNNNGGAGFMVGDKASLADFLFYGINLIFTQVSSKYLDDFPEMKNLIPRIPSVSENLKKYVESQKK